MARRHAASHGLAPGVLMSRGPVVPAGPITSNSHPLPLNPMVSDGSSTSSSGDSSTSQNAAMMLRAISDHSKAAQSGDDVSSVDSSSKPTNQGSKRALPKKKRKYVHV